MSSIVNTPPLRNLRQVLLTGVTAAAVLSVLGAAAPAFAQGAACGTSNAGGATINATAQGNPNGVTSNTACGNGATANAAATYATAIGANAVASKDFAAHRFNSTMPLYFSTGYSNGGGTEHVGRAAVTVVW